MNDSRSAVVVTGQSDTYAGVTEPKCSTVPLTPQLFLRPVGEYLSCCGIHGKMHR